MRSQSASLENPRRPLYLAHHAHRASDDRDGLAVRLRGDAARRARAERAATGASSTADDTLSGVLSEKEYRATFQTEAWTRAAWGGRFEVLEWLDGGLGGLQDLVLLRSRP